MKPVLAIAALTALSGCQLVLGFEEHVLAGGKDAGGSAPQGGEAGQGGGTVGTGGTGGTGPSLFGAPEEIASALGELEAVALAGANIYVLEHTAVEHRIQRIDAGGPVIVASNLSDARGLETANDEVLTTHGPLDGADPLCHLSAFTASERRDVMADECPDGANAFHAIAVEGATAAASFVVSQANDHSDVRRANLDGTDGTGILIGLGEDDGAGVPSVAIDGGTFFWVDSQFDDVMTSEGAELPGINNPPGATVNVLSSGLAGAGEVVLADGKPYLTLGSEVASLSTNGEVTSLGAAQSPRGLAADGALVVWAEPARVRAHVLASGQTVTVDDAGDEPVDVALASDFVVYVTRGGRVVRVPRL